MRKLYGTRAARPRGFFRRLRRAAFRLSKVPDFRAKCRFVIIHDFCAADRSGLPREGRPPSSGTNARFNISIAQTRQPAPGRVWKFKLTTEHLRIGRKRSRVDGRDETRP